MPVTINNHWLSGANYMQSPNCDQRIDEGDLSLIVIHCISLPPGQFGTHYIDQLFTNRLDPDEHAYFKTIHQLKVSAHVLISRDGIVTQYVPFNLRAWHAGLSSYNGRACCNDFSIGIELEGTEIECYTQQQYIQLVDIVKSLLKNYTTLSTQHITGHSDIAPGRKQDPGSGFDWDHFRHLLTKNTST
jgi:AmpD protein